LWRFFVLGSVIGLGVSVLFMKELGVPLALAGILVSVALIAAIRYGGFWASGRNLVYVGEWVNFFSTIQSRGWGERFGGRFLRWLGLFAQRPESVLAAPTADYLQFHIMMAKLFSSFVEMPKGVVRLSKGDRLSVTVSVAKLISVTVIVVGMNFVGTATFDDAQTQSLSVDRIILIDGLISLDGFGSGCFARMAGGEAPVNVRLEWKTCQGLKLGTELLITAYRFGKDGIGRDPISVMDHAMRTLETHELRKSKYFIWGLVVYFVAITFLALESRRLLRLLRANPPPTA
jgi:hypothetical protein